ncbi:hypothetical protein ACMYYO_07740 [Dermacoccaceae bacterium W4C1]
MEVVGWVALVVAITSLIAWRLTYTAARLDRLHGRVEGTIAALDAQLLRRAEASLDLARSSELPQVQALYLAAAATASLEEADAEEVTTEVRRRGLSESRESAENELTAALTEVLTPDSVAQLQEAGGTGAQALEMVRSTATRVQLSRRFYNDAVRDVRKVRAKRLVRWFRLAGRTELPESIEFDDSAPPAV